MIYAFIRSLIGNFGRALMDFYIQYSLFINALILGYALLVFIAHRNYYGSLEKIFTNIRSANEKFTQKGITKISAADYKNVNWDEISKSIKFPFISEPRKWTIRIINSNYLMREFSVEKLNGFLQEAKVKNG